MHCLHICLNPLSSFENSVDPDQLASVMKLTDLKFTQKLRLIGLGKDSMFILRNPVRADYEAGVLIRLIMVR